MANITIRNVKAITTPTTMPVIDCGLIEAGSDEAIVTLASE
jgi:hypothetical protein